MGLLSTAVSTVTKIQSSNEGKFGSASSKIVEDYHDVFEGLGKLNTVHKIRLKPNAVPYACAPRSVPYAIRNKLKDELDRLESLGIIQETKEATEWLNHIVPVLKPDGSLRICLNPQNLNNATVRDRYTLPKISDIYANLSGSKFYTTLDAHSGFHQIPIDKELSKLTRLESLRHLSFPIKLWLTW